MDVSKTSLLMFYFIFESTRSLLIYIVRYGCLKDVSATHFIYVFKSTRSLLTYFVRYGCLKDVSANVLFVLAVSAGYLFKNSNPYFLRLLNTNVYIYIY